MSRESILAALRQSEPPDPGLPEIEGRWQHFDDRATRFAAALEGAGGRCIRVPARPRIAATAVRACREADEENIRLHQELRALRLQLKEYEEGVRRDGTVVRRLTAGATNEEWGRAIDSSMEVIRLAFFTFDLPIIEHYFPEYPRAIQKRLG